MSWTARLDVVVDALENDIVDIYLRLSILIYHIEYSTIVWWTVSYSFIAIHYSICELNPLVSKSRTVVSNR